MTVPTVAVTVRLADFGGPANAGVTVTAKLSDIDYTSDGTIVSTEPVSAVTDASGVAVLNVFPNAIGTGLGTRGTTVKFSAAIPGSKSLKANAAVPNVACNLVDIMVDLEPISLSAAQMAIQQAQAAVAQAGANADSTSADANASMGYSEEAAAAKSLALDAKSAAEAARDQAVNSASSASDNAAQALDSASAASASAGQAQSASQQAQQALDQFLTAHIDSGGASADVATSQKIQLRRDTAANWTSVNPVLFQGEEGLELGTGLRKVGDGVTAWTSLPYSGVPLSTQLRAWAYAMAFSLADPTRNADGVITTSSIVWPDGTPGVYSVDSFNATFTNAVDAWHVTYAGSPARTVTQAALTRDANGAVTVQPEITIA